VQICCHAARGHSSARPASAALQETSTACVTDADIDVVAASGTRAAGIDVVAASGTHRSAAVRDAAYLGDPVFLLEFVNRRPSQGLFILELHFMTCFLLYLHLSCPLFGIQPWFPAEFCT